MLDFIPIWLILTTCALMGACIGSFLNVIIYRTPRGLSINNPSRSFCPSCQKPIPWFLNIPVISWLMLRGKCRYCHTPISPRYWFVEMGCALLFLLIGYLYIDDGSLTVALLCLWCAVAIVIIFIDAEHMLVFPSHAIIGTLLGFTACLTAPALISADEGWDHAAILSLLGASSGYLLIRLIIELGKVLFGKWHQSYPSASPWSLAEPDQEQSELRLILPDRECPWGDLFGRQSDRALLKNATVIIDGIEQASGDWTLSPDSIIPPKGAGKPIKIADIRSAHGTLEQVKGMREAMGYGDAWIMLMIGALCGWQGVLFCLFIGSIIGIIGALIARCGRGTPIPFGPSLLSAALIWLIGGNILWVIYCDWIIFHN
ncbi:MAG: prepilin peptidase [Akkermansia sp.]